ncbi:MAG TPA: hypothetical protein VG692_14080 [Gemmatimonadales bacterium]|nr:hypothetical protein [Gemmatimonadales bacterium]
MTLARRIYTIAGIYGLIVLLPLFAGTSRFTQDNPPALSHPVFYWGFAGVALAWQVAFLIIARDPVRYRPLMVATVLEKLIFGIAAVALYLAGETTLQFFGAALVDLVLGAFFLLAYLKTPRE